MFKKQYVKSQTFLLIFAFLSLNFSVYAADMGVPVQLRLRAPDMSYPTTVLSTVKLRILSKTGCVLRVEEFTNQNVNDGFLTLALGAGILVAADDPGLTLNAVYNNSVAKTGLKCVDADNVIIASGQTYTPDAGD